MRRPSLPHARSAFVMSSVLSGSIQRARKLL